MGFKENFFYMKPKAPGVERSLSTPMPMIGFPNTGGLVWSVSAGSSLGLSAVWRSLDILSNGVSQLPWFEKRGNLDLPASHLVQRPVSWMTRREWVSLVVSTLALYDTCFLLKLGGDDAEGVPVSLVPLNPAIISPLNFDPYSIVPPAEYQINGQTVPREDLVILHRSPTPGITETGGGVINLARQLFAAALAADAYASRYWQAGGAVNTVLEADGAVPDPIAQQISDRWANRRALGPDHAPVLTNGLKVRSLGADPFTESAVEARKELVSDIGRFFGIPTALLNSPASDSETYSSTESQGIHLVTYTLQNYLGAVEDAITDQLPGGRRLFIDPAPLYRGSQTTRAQAMQLATGGKPWMTQNEAREAEGLPPVENASDLEPIKAASPAGVSNG